MDCVLFKRYFSLLYGESNDYNYRLKYGHATLRVQLFESIVYKISKIYTFIYMCFNDGDNSH